ncbi:RCC1 domain-containing protein [Flavobacterium wongokense]|uniref:RCC1 domain-containing protein n=1 Tax=Flavobacterium wongokense TaxID=2910674 RepID=UPI001F3666A5|nr:T9SS type A sorting domain-containing protein [Flavobacterium sp. WG47]MCF6133403.1 T9SS type A sorting domain-containing protein [Flavobacterium sp. WG47]
MKHKYLVIILFFFIQSQIKAQCWQGFATIDHTLAVKSDGSLWAWGYNDSGQVGDGTAFNRNHPVRIGNEFTWQAVYTGGVHSFAIKTDGTLWAWGFNENGQLGDDTSVEEHTPIMIDGNWQTIAPGFWHNLGLKSDGTLWAWGYDNWGQLGDGSISFYNATPIQVGTDTNWAKIACGKNSSFAIKTNGSLWGWGNNEFGVLGIGNITTQYVPIQIGTATDWQKVDCGFFHTLAIKNDGTLWSWGHNHYGELGNGTTVDSYIPVQIGTATDWVDVSAGEFHSVARKSNGSIWAFGRNSEGQLGNGTTNNSSVPIQVQSSSTWLDVQAGLVHTIGLRSDGTLLSWGYNGEGQLGNGNFENQNSADAVDCPTILNTNNLNEASFSLYPNPVNETLNIVKPNGLDIQKMTIIDAFGKTILEFSGNRTYIDVSNLASGIYLIQIFDSFNQSQSIKFVKS